MRQMLRLVCAAAAVVLCAPGMAQAQGIGLHAYGIVDLDALTAKQTFEAVLGTSQLKAFGGGVEAVDIWKHVFVRAAVTRARKKGTRGFVSGSEFFPNGIGLTVTMTPIEAGAGWRFVSKNGSRFTPYAGVSFLSVGYSETSTFADPAENTSESFKGQAVFGGVEVGVLKGLAVTAEAQYRRVPDALGGGGVSKDFNETDLGGMTARITIGIRTRR
jgi:outer membrane protein with beta-barrel domain